MFTYEEFRVCIHAFLCLYTRFFARIHAAPLQKNRVSLQSPALTDGVKQEWTMLDNLHPDAAEAWKLYIARSRERHSGGK